MRFAAIVGAALVLTTYAAAPALAQAPYYAASGQAFTQTANATTFNLGQPVPDGRGGMAAPAVSDGTVSGTPINGTFHVDEIRAYSADGASGTMQGRFTFQDGAGSSLIGNLTGDFTLDATSSSVQGDYIISGGTGIYAGATGTGTFSELLALPDGTPLLSFAGTWVGQPGAISSLTAPTIYNPGIPSVSVGTAPVVQPIVVVPAAPVRIRSNDDDNNWWSHDRDDDHHDNGRHNGENRGNGNRGRGHDK
jgi:hypothetical protein